MNRKEAIYHLLMLANECKKSERDTECEAIQVALYDMGIVEHLQKERGCAAGRSKEFETKDKNKHVLMEQTHGTDRRTGIVPMQRGEKSERIQRI